MPTRYVRTPAGQAEIQARTRNLSRPVRNLLLVINDSRSIEDWVVGVNGVTVDDVAMLISEGLIAVAGGSAPAAVAPAPAPAPKPAKTADMRDAGAKPATKATASAAGDADWSRTQEVIRHAGYSALYDALNSVGKAKLGLVRGYRFALEVEKCSGVEEIRALALKFCEQLRAEHGMAAVGELTYAIGAVKA